MDVYGQARTLLIDDNKKISIMQLFDIVFE